MHSFNACYQERNSKEIIKGNNTHVKGLLNKGLCSLHTIDYIPNQFSIMFFPLQAGVFKLYA